MSYPQWVVLHVPHDATEIPDAVRGQFVLSDAVLAAEIENMTDHYTLDLFSDPRSNIPIVRAPVSRLVVDVERFASDDREPMAPRGMGAIYTMTSQLKALRRPLTVEEHDALLQTYYHPHHARLESEVSAALEHHDRCLVIDCHSFPDVALPYELADVDSDRPDICLGTDDFHTGDALAGVFVERFHREGLTVSVNTPFAGAMVPASRYRRDRRVSAVMVEVNRRLYLSPSGAERVPGFDHIAKAVRRCCADSIETAIAQKLL